MAPPPAGDRRRRWRCDKNRAVLQAYPGPSDKYHLHQQHIGNGAAGDGQERIAPPQVQSGGDGNGNALRQPLTGGGEGDVPQTVHQQQAHHGRRQQGTQLLQELGQRLAVGEQDGRQEPGDDGTHGDGQQDDECLDGVQAHSFFLPISRLAKISTIEGITR